MTILLSFHFYHSLREISDVSEWVKPSCMDWQCTLNFFLALVTVEFYISLFRYLIHVNFPY